jgi:hypothetical protein
MTSLTDVYEGDARRATGARRRRAGIGLFVVGVALVVAAIPLATTEAGAWLGLSTFEGRELAGVLAGIGLPAVFVGVLAGLPASAATRAGAAIGASLSLMGVALFGHAYPYNWLQGDPVLALATTLLYFAGAITTFWCVFVAVATFRTRTAPGGTATVQVTEEGTVRLVEQARSLPGMGGVGLFGRDPEGDVETQTNHDEPTIPGPAATVSDGGDATQSTPTTDGADVLTSEGETHEGAATDPAPEPEFVQAAQERGSPDRYCGNCTHFEYVKVDDDIAPYCGVHQEVMDDMDACDRWSATD